MYLVTNITLAQALHVPQDGPREGAVVDPVHITFNVWVCHIELLVKLTILLNKLSSFNPCILLVSIQSTC